MCLLTGINAAATMALINEPLPQSATAPLIVLLGLLAPIAATGKTDTHQKAEKDLIKQYALCTGSFRMRG